MSERIKVSDPTLLTKRYESLKRLYFSPHANRLYEDGEEIPNATPREVLVLQFEQMGCEIPLSPTQPFTPLRKRPE